MTLCEHINNFNAKAGELSYKYSQAATFGRATPKLYYSLLSVNALLRTLNRQITGTRTVKTKFPVEGQTVPFSSLKSANNTLFLDSSITYKCLTTDIRPCLSESEICSIIERLDLIFVECNI